MIYEAFFYYIFFGILTIFPSLACAQTNQVSLTTYYPAPFGAYDRLRLVARDHLGGITNTCTDAEEGTIYVDKDNNNVINRCRLRLWSPLTGGVIKMVAQAANFDDENLTPAIDQYVPVKPYGDLTANAPYLGIGTDNPKKPLHISVNKNAVITALAIENAFDAPNGISAGTGISFRGNLTSQGKGSFVEMAALRVIYDTNSLGPGFPNLPPARDATGMDFFVRNGPTDSNIRILNLTAYDGGKVGIRTAIPHAILEVNTFNSLYTLAFGVSSNSIAQVNGDIFSVLSTGNVGIGVTAPNVKLDVNGVVRATKLRLTSDAGLKKNIQPIPNALEKISRLNGVSFEWKDNSHDQGKQMGVIAQNIEKTFPEAVSGPEGSKSVDYPSLIAPLIEAVKQLKQDNENLSRQIHEQSTQIFEQKHEIETLQKSLQTKEPSLTP